MKLGAINDTREQEMTLGAENDITTEQPGAKNDTREQKMTSEQKMTPGSKK